MKITLERIDTRGLDVDLGGDRVALAETTALRGLLDTAADVTKLEDVAAERIVLVHDELDIPFDTLKLKVGGGHGGHNGIRDVAKALGTPEFPRVRVGIGRPPGRQDPADWVLDPFAAAERMQLPLVIADAADAVEQLIDEGLLAAQQRHHAPRA